jgi:hypothetical protein
MNQELVNEQIILEMIIAEQLIDDLKAFKNILVCIPPLPNGHETQDGCYDIIGCHGRQ